MFNFSLESFIGNFSFVVLFLIMIFYWFQAIFHILPKFNQIIVLFTLCANFSLIILLILRWLTYHYFPLSNLYESLIFLSWSLNLIQLIFLYSKFNNTNLLMLIGTIVSPMALFTDSFATFSLPRNMQKAQALVPALQSNWLMMHVTVMMLSYAALLFGSLLSISFLIINWVAKKQKMSTKINSIQNNINSTYFSNISQYSIVSFWLYLNKRSLFKYNQNETYPPRGLETSSISNSNESDKNTNMIATTCYNYNFSFYTRILNFLANIISNFTKIILGFFSKNTFETNLLYRKNNINNKILEPNTLNEFSKTLDNLSYRILGIGFPLLTIGILSGAVWANEAWGSYWSWDPKETWAFITWLVFAMYLHGRIIKKWEGQKAAIVASLGFFIIWICYLGVNILGTGLHSYGWVK